MKANQPHHQLASVTLSKSSCDEKNLLYRALPIKLEKDLWLNNMLIVSLQWYFCHWGMLCNIKCKTWFEGEKEREDSE